MSGRRQNVSLILVLHILAGFVCISNAALYYNERPGEGAFCGVQTRAMIT
jgi:hypothetical protein